MEYPTKIIRGSGELPNIKIVEYIPTIDEEKDEVELISNYMENVKEAYITRRKKFKM